MDTKLKNNIKGIKTLTSKRITIAYTIKPKSNLKMQFWMYHRVSRITGYIGGEVYKTNIETIINHFLLHKTLRYQEVLKNRFTQFGIKTEPIASEYYKNT